jgi:L-lactate dehydrogenase
MSSCAACVAPPPEIIERKGYTSFAIAACVTRICEAVLRNEHTVLPVSTMMTGQHGIKGIYLSLPCVIGRRGIERVIELPLSEAAARRVASVGGSLAAHL